MERGAQLGIVPTSHCGPGEHQIHGLFRIETDWYSKLPDHNDEKHTGCRQYTDRLVLDLQFTISKLNGDQ